MKVPKPMPACLRDRTITFAPTAGAQGLTAQGCNVFEWASCAAAVAGCTALTGPALVACVASVAPGCVKCVT
jgi:hypothetical protein